MGRKGPGRRALLGSLGLHAALLGGTLLAGVQFGRPQPEFRVYRVNIVSPPPAQVAEATPPAEPEPEPPEPEPEPPTPEPEPAPPEPEPPPPEPEPEPEPEPTPQPERRPEPERPPPPAPEPREEPRPQPRPAEREQRRSGEGLNVQLTGEEFPYPEYLENIVRQIHRHFRWTGTQGLEAEVYFAIRPDGSVEDIRLLRGSGDVSFNFEALGAIEQAGNRRAFGPLPPGFQGDRLPISFYFRPQR